MGFDAGNRANYYAHSASRTSGITTLVSTTNCGYNGRWIYSVAGAVIIPVAEGN